MASPIYRKNTNISDVIIYAFTSHIRWYHWAKSWEVKYYYTLSLLDIFTKINIVNNIIKSSY